MTRAQKIAEARRMKANGASKAQIATKFGVGLATVSIWLNHEYRHIGCNPKKRYRIGKKREAELMRVLAGERLADIRAEEAMIGDGIVPVDRFMGDA